jgi:hypothetical protein
MLGSPAAPAWLIEQEARAILVRLARVRPFALQETMVAAAAPSPAAIAAIDRFLLEGRHELRDEVRGFLRWLRGAAGTVPPTDLQRRFTVIRLRFNNVLSHFDLFSDAITQRSEADDGVLLGGLDVAASDALRLRGHYYEPPPIICYLDRGPGAAIRRARTRLPGRKENPVAVIRVPRERMVGHGIASSLVHEVGHQGAALLGLVDSLRVAIQQHRRSLPPERARSWQYWQRWISEIVADFWSVGRVGVTSTLGLIGVVSLPQWFVFRINVDDPHPTPYVRVLLSCAIGKRLYPHAQWDRVAAAWDAMYPLSAIGDERRAVIEALLPTIPEFTDFLAAFRPPALRGDTLGHALSFPDRAPERLLGLHRRWSESPELMRSAPPSLVFAVLGQARLAGELDPEPEARQLHGVITAWALRSTLDITELCAGRTNGRRRAVAAPPTPTPVPTH